MSNIALPCDKQESGSMMNVNRTEVKGGWTGIRKIGSRTLSNQNRESLWGRQQASVGLEGSLNVDGGKSVVFTHFQDKTTKTSMIGSYGIVWAKRTIEGTDIRVKEAGTPFNLKTKRLVMGWTEIRFNKIGFVERG